jgi:membrane protease subunit HflC
MPRWLALVIVAVLMLLAFTGSYYVVPQTDQAIILRLGQYQRTVNALGRDEAGLHLKIPFVDRAVLYPRQDIGFVLQMDEQRAIIAADQERLVVDAFVLWRITDPRLFYRAATTEDAGQDRLSTSTDASLRRILGAASSNDIISGRRAQLMQEIQDDLNRNDAAQLGVQIVDLRIRAADFPPQIEEQVFQRMRTEREQMAALIRAEGVKQGITIRATADRNVTVIKATATEQSERLRGQGDSERARIFAEAYGRDPEFAAFYRSMRAYDAAITAGTPVVVPADSDFFRYLRNQRGLAR